MKIITGMETDNMLIIIQNIGSEGPFSFLLIAPRQIMQLLEFDGFAESDMLDMVLFRGKNCSSKTLFLNNKTCYKVLQDFEQCSQKRMGPGGAKPLGASAAEAGPAALAASHGNSAEQRHVGWGSACRRGAPP
jgi:hypothetical protein